MNATRRDKLKALFDQAHPLPPEQQAVFLDEACRDDAALRENLASLLKAYNHAPDYFESLAGAVLPEPLKKRMEKPKDNKTDDAADRQIGRRISHYEIQEKLGGGGMGVVYKARHGQLDRFAALKFLSPHLSADDEAKQRFIHEAKTASALDHANICTIFDIGETDSGQLYIAMAYYEGETLKKKIRRGPLPLEEVLDYAVQMAEGLSKAHAGGIVHRDVKPANVMVTHEGVVKLVDFGIAKMGDAGLTQTGTTMGTLAYMSPEQARGEEVDARADIWSLGIMLYEMLTGQRPFQGHYEQAILYALLNTDPVPLSQLAPDLPREIARIVDKCLEKNQDDRYQTAVALFTDLYRVRRQVRSGSGVARSVDADVAVRQAPHTALAARARVFISYKRSAEPDDRVAEAIRTALSRHHEVFIDKMLLVGTRWIEQLEAELARSDFLIVLLSAHSVHSEMVLGEIETARRLANERGGRPIILPVRLAYQKPFAYPLSAYVDAFNWAYWEDDEDTPGLIEKLGRAITEGNLDTPAHPQRLVQEPQPGTLPEPLMAAQPLRLEMPEGTMDPQSAFYIERPEDAVALRAIARQGVTITIKGPRQMGKSSLLMHTMAAAAEAGKEVVFLDFQLFEQAVLQDADTFFRQFCTWITDELDLEDEVDAYWKRPLGNPQRCTRYMARHVLKTLDAPLLLAMDEVERVFDSDFRSDFFSMLRSWHNDRAFKPRWKRLDLALVTSTEPYQLIENLNQSPFNVGEVIALKDFSPEQVADLNRRHGAPLSDEQLNQLMGLLGGHPYLVRKALFLVASGRITLAELLATALDERNPFGDHLRYHFFRFHGQDDLVEGLRQVLHDGRCDDEGVFWRLRGAGLVRRAERAVVPRCKLYADYFRERLHG